MKKGNIFWLKFLVGLGIMLISFAVGYGMLNQKVSNHNKRIEKVEIKAGEAHDKIIKIEVDVEHIRKTVDRIEKKL